MKKLLCAGISTCDVYVTGAKSLPEPNTAQEVDRIFFQVGGGAANAMIDYCGESGCLRQYIRTYFGENAPDRCGGCSSCCGHR